MIRFLAMNLKPAPPNVKVVDCDGLFLEEVAQARAMSGEERFQAGGDLFDFACDSARAGIRAAMGTSDSARVEARLRERLHLQHLLEERVPQ